MTRKQLPKAITRTIDELRSIATGAVADAEAPARRAAPRYDAVEAEPDLANSHLAISDLAISSSPIANDFAAAAPLPNDPHAAKRRSLARKIVERHKMYAAAGGLVPLPIANIAGVTAIIVRMVKALSDLYGVPFERDRTRSMIVGLTGGAVPTGLGAATASSLAFVVPGAALVGLAVSAVTAAAFTRGIGLVFLEHFESGAMPPVATEIKPA